MALATNTATGTIKLAGDLAGNNDATAPELSPSGVTAGEYLIPITTVDGKGRITSIDNTDDTNILPFLPVATDSSKGVLEVDTSNGLTIAAGVLGFDEAFLDDATDTSKGIVQIDTSGGLIIAAGVLGFDATAIADATDTTKGVVQIDTASGLLAITAGVLSFADSALPDATNSSKGFVEIDEANGLTIAAGILSFDPVTIDDATASSKGLVQIDTSNGLTIAAGILGFDDTVIDDATNTTKGVVQIDTTHLTIASGVLGIVLPVTPDATDSSKGLVQIDTSNGLTIAAGILDVAPATNTTFGTVKSADTNNITITAGAIDVGTNVALKDQDNAFTKTQSVAVNTLTYSANITPDGSVSNVMEVTLTGNTTLENPTNLIAGAFYSVQITQDATGSRTMAYGTAFKFKGGVTPTLSTAVNSIDILTCISDGTNLYSTLTKDLS